jgi:acetyl-CoA carboxylase carboxyl transferase subunit beta
MVDMVIHRHEIRATLSRLCQILTKMPRKVADPLAPVQAEEPIPAVAAQ